MPLVAGVDCSTQATKVVVVDTDDGTVRALGRATHPVTGEGGARETDPEAWWQSMTDALAQTGLAHQIKAIAIAAQQHGLVTLDEHRRPLRPAVLWNDVRPADDAAELVDKLGGRGWWSERVGSVPLPAFTAAKWAWLRRAEPAVTAATRAVRLPHDYLTERLTGQPVTDRGDASGTGWWSTGTGGYVPEVLDALELDEDLLPRVAGPFEPVGTVHRDVATRLGLPADAVVGPGTADNAGAALGLGVGEGAPVLSLGTSGTVYAVSARRPVDPTGVVSGFADASGRFLPLACTLNCTLAVDRMAELLGRPRDAVEPGGEVVVLPFFDGERTPNLPAAAGTVTGLRHGTTAGQLLRATYEGAVLALLLALEEVGTQAGGLDPDAPLVLIGGGARGQVWQDVVARLSGRALLIPEADELVALGAAVQAAAALTGGPAEQLAAQWQTSQGHRIPARPRDDAAVERIRSVLAAAHPVLR